MEFTNVIKKRKSTRGYLKKEVPRDVLNKIAEAGVMAPSACNNQPWHFLIISQPELKEKIHCSYNREWFKSAPHILVVKGNKSSAWIREDGYNSLETDLAIAMDHMILAAEDLGVQSCWVGNFNKEILYKALSLSEEEEIFAMTPLGYNSSPEDEKEKKRKDFHKVVTFI